MMRCKACGYLMKEGETGDRCPACGAPRTAFEPATDPLARPRRRLLSLQLHPVAVHFPVALATATLVFSLAIPFLTGEGKNLLVSAAKLLALLLPFLAAAAFLAGWVDGRARFRKIRNSAILKRKIGYAAVLLAVSSGLAAAVWAGGYGTVGATLAAILLSAAAVGCVYVLGRLGTSIVGSALAGA
jgi:O-antigen/teichoic acid export membrane protein